MKKGKDLKMRRLINLVYSKREYNKAYDKVRCEGGFFAGWLETKIREYDDKIFSEIKRIEPILDYIERNLDGN